MYCISPIFSLSTLFSPLPRLTPGNVNLPYAAGMGSVRLGTQKKGALGLGAASIPRDPARQPAIGKKKTDSRSGLSVYTFPACSLDSNDARQLSASSFTANIRSMAARLFVS